MNALASRAIGVLSRPGIWSFASLNVFLAGILLLISSLVGSADGFLEAQNLTYMFMALISIIAGMVGVLLLPPCRGSSQRFHIIGACFFSFILLIFYSGLIYWISGAFDFFDDALFESVSGFSTSSFSVLTDIENTDRAVLFWRSGTQWLGGLWILYFLTLVLPHLMGNRDMSEAPGSRRVFVSNTRLTMNRILAVYMLLTLLLAAGYSIFGMSSFDAFTHSFTTISTGGFSNHSDGLLHFSSAGVEWVAIAGMLAAGIRPAVLWWIISGSPTSFWKGLELRIYLALAAAASFFVFVSGVDFRESVFSAVSAISSTGFYLYEWGEWSSGLQVLMLVLISTGAMAGTAGGGFRIMRAVHVLSYTYRELLRQMHSKAVFMVKMDKKPVTDETLINTQFFQFLYLSTASLGAFGLAVLGSDLLTSISASFSAIATMGPALGDLDVASGVLDMSRPERSVLGLLMLLGRVSIYPLLMLVWTILASAYNQGKTNLAQISLPRKNLLKKFKAGKSTFSRQG